MSPQERSDLLTPAEVAAIFRVSTKTVTRWAQAGKLPSMRTLGGHRRYSVDDINELLGDVVGHLGAAEPLAIASATPRSE